MDNWIDNFDYSVEKTDNIVDYSEVLDNAPIILKTI